jgi:dihydroxyacetone kinase DhaKLM complex PTS-EIIA-like component DhaM
MADGTGVRNSELVIISHFEALAAGWSEMAGRVVDERR